jgi:hypothetical protein
MPFTNFQFDDTHSTDINCDPELWRQVYSVHRYLQDLTDPQVDERYEIILNNKASFSRPEHIALKPLNRPESFWYWARREQELEEEFAIRQRPLPQVIFRVPDAIRQLVPPVPRPPLNGPLTTLARFASHRYLWQAFDEGKFRLRHARTFTDSGLNDAQRDDELVARTYSPGSQASVVTPTNRTIQPIGQITYEQTHDGDAYLLCTAYECDPWLFHYFGADACLVVKDIESLRLRLDAAIRRQLPSLQGVEFNARYLDELNPNPVNLAGDDPAMLPRYRPLQTKSLKYALQKEFRYVWHSPGKVDPSAPVHVDLQIGPLRDIAAYFRLDPGTGTLVEQH